MRGIRPYPIILDKDGIEKKECHWCHEFKPLDEFYKNIRYTHGLQPYCKDCFSTYSKNRNTKEKNKTSNLKKYGLTIELYEMIYKEQEGKCAICGKFQDVLNVDHNHETKKIRKLLCSGCNSGIGCFNEDIELLFRAAIYLTEQNK